MDIVYMKNSEKLALSISEKMAATAFPANLRYFNNKEISVSVEKSFQDVVVIGCTKTNDDWIELLLLLDAIQGAENIVLCLSYMGYSRQDEHIPNESSAAGMFSRILEQMNVKKFIIVDNHSEPLTRIPTLHISANSIFEKDISTKYAQAQVAIVSPDFGGVRRAYEISKSIRSNLIICNKSKNVFGELKKVAPIGSVSDKICVLVDDMVDSGATLCRASESLIKAGSRGVIAYCTHAVLSDGAIERLDQSNITEIVLTDSIFIKNSLPAKFRKLSIDSLLIDAIQYIL
jgi:ribose-phosphate pyrophosphokinase